MKRSICAVVATGLLVLASPVSSAPPKIKATTTNEWTPSTKKIVKGTKLIFSNPSPQPHDFKPYKGPWPSKEEVWLYEGESVTRKFKKPGKYFYRCVVHSEMDNGECTGMCGVVRVTK